MSDDQYHGSATMADGTRRALTSDGAKALWDAAEAAEAKRAADMPTARDALEAVCAAEQRLNTLGWWKGRGFGIKKGEECAVAQPGSTGIWKGRIDDEGDVHFGDCHAKRNNCYLKPLADLSDDERSWMEECDQREREAFRAWLDRQPQQE